MKEKLRRFWSKFVYVMDYLVDGLALVVDVLATIFVAFLVVVTVIFVALAIIEQSRSMLVLACGAAACSVLTCIPAIPCIAELFYCISDMVIEHKYKTNNNMVEDSQQ